MEPGKDTERKSGNGPERTTERKPGSGAGRTTERKSGSSAERTMEIKSENGLRKNDRENGTKVRNRRNGKIGGKEMSDTWNDGITEKTKFGEMMRLPGIAPFQDYILRGHFWKNDILPLVTPEFFPGKAEDIVYGLQRLKELGDSGIRPVYLYDPPFADKRMADVNVIPFPARGGEEKPYAIIIPGGSFITTFALTEGFPIAAKLNEMGYSAFVLSYQIDGVGLFPRPFDDIAAAIRWIDQHAAEVHAKPGVYFAAGFSAGAAIDSLWGTKQVGYAHYGLPKPRALFTIYGPINRRKNPPLPGRTYEDSNRVCFGILPDGLKLEGVTMEPCYADEMLDGDYPPSFIGGCKDDPIVNPAHWNGLKEALDLAGVQNVLEVGESGGHGYGLGRNTAVKGWLERAVQFMERQE